ncbi:YoaK family protein [Streptomyces sp. NPDC002133]|uniref:YoaK family protein n=1 Tax=Streptomyces sp. NPDC002133 TaxID=3154409 RepID=UPI00332EEA79
MNGSTPDNHGPRHAPAHGDRLRVPLTALTVVTGLVDAISYLGLGQVFTANMTGNVVIIAFAAAGAPGFSLLASLVSLAAFLGGAVVAGRLTLALRQYPPHRWLCISLAVEAVLLLIAAAVAFAVPHQARYPLIVLTAVAMGIRNGTIRKLAVPDMTTTVLTLTVTGLAFDSSLAGGTNRGAARRIIAVLAILAGALLGAWLVLHHGLGWPLLISAVSVAATALVLLRIPAAQPRSA